MSSPVVATLGKYQLVKKLATGGMAEVYLTKTIGPGGFEKTLVLKRVLPQLAADESFLQMFLSEAKLAAQLNHPNVVSIFDFGQEGDSWYLVMEFIDGPNLRALSKRAVELGMPIPFELAAKIVALACEGLAYAHELTDEAGAPLDLVHRDISPDNILLARNGAVKVVDFGIAKAANQSHTTKTGSIKGKFAYMPPEQLRGELVDRRADVFALGIVLYELLTGSKPFATTTDALIMQSILFEPFTPVVEKRPDTPVALQAVLARALEKARDQRYPDCRALQADLEKFLAQQPNPAGQQQLAQLVARLANPDGAAMATPSRPSLPKLSPVEAAAPTQPMVPTPMPAPPPVVRPPPKSKTPIFAAVAGVAVLIAIGAFVFKGEPTPPAPVPAPVPGPVAEPERPPGVLRPLHPEVLQRPVPVETTPVPAPAEPAPRPKVVKPARVQFGQVDFRVRPFATVYVDGALIGDTPFSKQKLSVGSHTVKLVNKELGKDKTLTFDVKPGDNTLKYNFESE